MIIELDVSAETWGKMEKWCYQNGRTIPTLIKSRLGYPVEHVTFRGLKKQVEPEAAAVK